jgi:hypothetical protein
VRHKTAPTKAAIASGSISTFVIDVPPRLLLPPSGADPHLLSFPEEEGGDDDTIVLVLTAAIETDVPEVGVFTVLSDTEWSTEAVLDTEAGSADAATGLMQAAVARSRRTARLMK